MCKEQEEPLLRVQERDLGRESMGAMGTEVGTEAGRGDGVTRENVRKERTSALMGTGRGRAPCPQGDKGPPKPLSTEHFVEPLISEPIPSPMGITVCSAGTYRNRDLAEGGCPRASCLLWLEGNLIGTREEILRGEQKDSPYSARTYSVCVPSHSSHVQLCDPMDCGPSGGSVHGILQARTLAWVAMFSSGGSSRPRDRTPVSYVSCTGRRVLYQERHQGSPTQGVCLAANTIVLKVPSLRPSTSTYGNLFKEDKRDLRWSTKTATAVVFSEGAKQRQPQCPTGGDGWKYHVMGTSSG